MNVRLNPHSEALLKVQLAHGAFRSPEEVIERALESLAEKESTQAARGLESLFTVGRGHLGITYGRDAGRPENWGPDSRRAQNLVAGFGQMRPSHLRVSHRAKLTVWTIRVVV